jgi:trigger factor
VSTEDCKRTIEVEIPVDEVNKARERVTNSIRQRVRLPGFRPGKAPTSLIQSRFEGDIRSEVLEILLPESFRKEVQEQGLSVVGTPNISELKYESGEPIRYKAEFEVAPEVEVGEYRGLPAKYEEPTVTDEEVDQRLEQMRDRKAEYVNLDPRPIQDGDYVMTRMRSLEGVAEPIDQEIQFHVGSEETLPEFRTTLVGMSPEETREIEITYPADYDPKLAGKTVKFELTPKVIRQKDLPALDDEFAKDMGDFQTLDELKEAVRKAIFNEKQGAAQSKAKEELIDRLVEAHQFPVPEAYIDRQIENNVRSQISEMMGGRDLRDIDLSKMGLDWKAIKEKQRDQAVRNVRASLLLDKISDKEGIRATKEEVDREVQLMARQAQEAVPVTRARLEKDGTLGRIASVIQTQKTLQFLFDNATKQA